MQRKTLCECIVVPENCTIQKLRWLFRKMCGILFITHFYCMDNCCMYILETACRNGSFRRVVGLFQRKILLFFREHWKQGEVRMKKTGIVTDSHSSISQELAKKLGIWVIPMPFYDGDQCFYEGVNLSKDEFFVKLAAGVDFKTSQPSPAEVMKMWDEALLEYKEILYIPLSSGLSGSCQTAAALATEPEYEGRVFVVDNGRVATLLHRSVLDALEMIEEGYSAAEIKEALEEAKARMVIYIGVQTLENLKRGGRITPTAAMIGTMLNIKPVLKFDIGILDQYKKCRGFHKAKRTMLDAIHHDLEITFKEEYEKGEVYLLAASSADEKDAAEWVKEIEEEFPGMEVLYDDLSFGVSCHIGYGGQGIGLSCRPKRPVRV